MEHTVGVESFLALLHKVGGYCAQSEPYRMDGRYRGRGTCFLGTRVKEVVAVDTSCNNRGWRMSRIRNHSMGHRIVGRLEDA